MHRHCSSSVRLLLEQTQWLSTHRSVYVGQLASFLFINLTYYFMMAVASDFVANWCDGYVRYSVVTLVVTVSVQQTTSCCSVTFALCKPPAAAR